MKKRATLQDIADQAGVGIATVDRVLNGRAPVSEATALRVVEAARELDFHAHKLMRNRVESMLPEKRLAFILQKESKPFYRLLAAAITNAADAVADARIALEISFISSLSPHGLADEIQRLRPQSDAIGIVSIDHPMIAAELEICHQAGIPVFALLSRLSSEHCTGYVGIDGRRAGRTAGWAMSRLLRKPGSIGILVGSHRYLGHEALEVGFRSFLRENCPDRRLRDSIVYLDDEAIAYEAASELLKSGDDLCGIYQCGGGVEGVVKALEEGGKARDLIYICHEAGPTVKNGLVNGTVDLALVTPIEQIAQQAIHAMLHSARTGDNRFQERVQRFEMVTPESI